MMRAIYALFPSQRRNITIMQQMFLVLVMVRPGFNRQCAVDLNLLIALTGGYEAVSQSECIHTVTSSRIRSNLCNEQVLTKYSLLRD